MIQRSKVRQMALNLVYASLQNSGQSRELFWDIALEKPRAHFNTCLSKSILHVARQSTVSEEKLQQGLAILQDAMHGDMSTTSIRTDLDRLSSCSTKFEAALVHLRHKVADKRRDESESLAPMNQDVLTLSQIMLGLAQDLPLKLADFIAYEADAKVLLKELPKRLKLMEQVALLRKADELPKEGEFKGLCMAAEELNATRPLVERLADPVLAQTERWETLIAPLLKNYSLERMDQIDKCILSIMLYELLDEKLPLPVAISEATSLAHSYSGGKSAPFIHGILAAAAQQAKNSPQ